MALAALSDEPKFETLLSIPDDSEPSLTLYTPMIPIPRYLPPAREGGGGEVVVYHLTTCSLLFFFFFRFDVAR